MATQAKVLTLPDAVSEMIAKLSKARKEKPEQIIAEAVELLRRQMVIERYAGKGELAEIDDNPPDTSGKVRKAINARR